MAGTSVRSPSKGGIEWHSSVVLRFRRWGGPVDTPRVFVLSASEYSSA